MTRAILTLIVVGGVTYAVRSFEPAGTETLSPGVTLAVGFLLIVAIEAGHISERLRLPQMTGFILAGFICGPGFLGVISARSLESLGLVKGVSVGIIALIAGAELNLTRLRPRLRAIGAYAGASLVFSAILLFGFFFFFAAILPVTRDLDVWARMTIALVCANVLSAFSPPVVIGILSEARAAGPMSDLWISIAVLTDLVIVVSFSITNALARTVFPREESAAELKHLIVHIFGSIGVGVLVGIVFVWYMKAVAARAGLFVFMALFVVAEAGTPFGLNPLLAGLAAGLFLENVSPLGGQAVIEATEPVAMPLYAIFFAVIGAELQVGAFMHVAPFAIAAAVVRAAGIFAGSAVAGRWLGAPRAESRLAAYGMVPQAGIALALAALVLNSFQPWGRVVGTVLLGSIVVNQMIGPILLRTAVFRSGEAGRKEEREIDAGEETLSSSFL